MKVIIVKYRKLLRALPLINLRAEQMKTLRLDKYPIVEYRESKIGDIYITRKELSR